MIVTILPASDSDLYSLLIKEELSLRKKNKGTLHRTGKKKRNEDKWVHNVLLPFCQDRFKLEL